MRILALVAGTNDPSNADVLADAFLRGAKEYGGNVQKIRLKDLTIDHFELKHYDRQTSPEPDFVRIAQAVGEADGIVIASPVWNFSVPAHLKNLLDRLGSVLMDENHAMGTLNGKPFYFMYSCGSPSVAFPLLRRTLSHLAQHIRYFRGTVLGTHIEPRCTPGKGVFGLVVDKRPNSLNAVSAKGKHFALAVDTFKKTGKLPLREALSLKLWTWAQKIRRKLGL
jgi:NAD(P)H-dependent FMN reductase